MDLLCSESLVNDSEPLYHFKTYPHHHHQHQQQQQQHQQQQKTKHKHHSNSCSSSYSSCSSASSSSFSTGTGACENCDADADAAASITNSSNTSSNGMSDRDRALVLVYTGTDAIDTTGGTSDDLLHHQQQQKQQQHYQPPHGNSRSQEEQQQLASTATSDIRELTTSAQAPFISLQYINKLNNVNTAIMDPTFNSDRCLEIALKAEEKYQHISAAYFITVQRDITPAMRKIVAEWMMEVCAEEKCQEEVVLLALNYMDRFLSNPNAKSIRKTQLQILAAACLLLASKLREPSCRALSVDLLVVYSDNSINKKDLIKWELYVLSRLGWDLSSVTPLDFLELLIIRLPLRNNTSKVRQHAQAFISLAAKEHQFTKYPASTIAASSIAASMSGLKLHLRSGCSLNYFLGVLTDLTSVEQDQLQECMLQMEAIFQEHSRKLEPYLVGIEQQQRTQNAYYYSQPHQCQQMTHSVASAASAAGPDLTQTCKMQAQTQTQGEMRADADSR
ncbi:G1/S-specific cyclin-D1 [Drosophila tropicalis]|uniref:G1/S-specific cyclin-D1 n=1 Tax=Drosophila tropicalis TaxID=46794 RepID=UPI0035ABC65D